MTDVEWVPYEDRPEWSDVKPVPQNDGPVPIVQIAYSDKFRDIFNYFRAVLASREISERAFKLSEDAASMNASSYTVWHYRRILLQELKKDLTDELEYIKQVIEDNPKNYQIWHHRQVLVDWLKDPSKEKKFTEQILSEDSKNYHAWQHRQWVVRTFDLWNGELEFVSKLLEQDVRNNSAWNQRFFVFSHRNPSNPSVDQEIKYTLQQIEKAPNNESPWNYLRGILQDGGLSQSAETEAFAERLLEEGVCAPHLMAFLIDLWEEKMLGDVTHGHLLERALQLSQSLSSEHDVIRKEYWNFVERNLRNLYSNEAREA